MSSQGMDSQMLVALKCAIGKQRSLAASWESFAAAQQTELRAIHKENAFLERDLEAAREVEERFQADIERRAREVDLSQDSTRFDESPEDGAQADDAVASSVGAGAGAGAMGVFECISLRAAVTFEFEFTDVPSIIAECKQGERFAVLEARQSQILGGRTRLR